MVREPTVRSRSARRVEPQEGASTPSLATGPESELICEFDQPHHPLYRWRPFWGPGNSCRGPAQHRSVHLRPPLPLLELRPGRSRHARSVVHRLRFRDRVRGWSDGRRLATMGAGYCAGGQGQSAVRPAQPGRSARRLGARGVSGGHRWPVDGCGQGPLKGVGCRGMRTNVRAVSALSGSDTCRSCRSDVQLLSCSSHGRTVAVRTTHGFS